MIPLFYSLTNIYNIKTSINKKIDVLISGIPTCKDNQINLDGIDVSYISGTMPYSTLPIYILHLSDLNNVYNSFHIRTNDINVKKLNNFNSVLLNYLNNIIY